MLKRIQKHQVRAGMFIEDLEGEWTENPMSRRRFTISDTADIEHLKNTCIAAVIINTAKGLDVDSGVDTLASRDRTGTTAVSAASDANERRAAVLNVKESVQALKGFFADAAFSARNIAPVADQIAETMQKNPLVLLNITRLKSKDETTFVHSIAVSALMVQLARYVKLDAKMVQLMGMAGLLHDVGKTKIPDDVLNKQGKLAEEELALIRDHPALGHEILSRQADMPKIVLDICRHHHERLDGKGYPDGLPASEISLYVRICTICDVYDAVTSIRPYKKPWSHMDAVNWMMAQQGAFDRELLHEFFSSMETIMETRRRA
ncbi:MAG: phosphohydrolase [Rhizobium sp.]|nr:phosphohydrolase [Rhizobium sp.]